MLGASWKVRLIGLGIMALGFVGHPLNHYLPIAGLNWATFCASAVVVLTGGGLMLAKQYDVHGGTIDTGVRPAPVPVTIAPPVPGTVIPVGVPLTRPLNQKPVVREDLP
jgi:hypothetical protein